MFSGLSLTPKKLATAGLTLFTAAIACWQMRDVRAASTDRPSGTLAAEAGTGGSGSAGTTDKSSKTADDKDTKAMDASEKGENFAEKHPIPKGGPYPLPKIKGTFLRAPYLQSSTTNSIYVVWRLTKPMAKPVVKYGMVPGALDSVVPEANIALRRLAEEGDKTAPLYSAPAGTHQYEAHITGLKPDTKYFYAVCDAAESLASGNDYYFRTLPEYGKARDCLFWIVGDSGTGRPPQPAVHLEMQRWVAKNGLDLDLYTHVGDMAYNNGKDIEFTDRFFAIYDETLRHTVCFPAQGNHEGHSSSGLNQTGPFYDAYICPTKGEAGGVPSGSEGFYSYDFGRVHFIVLNSHDLDRRQTGVMARWLKEDLSKIKPDKTDWTLAYWHHPPYTKGSHDSDKEKQLVEMRKYIVPILDSSGVDLCFTGHSHIYERSMLIDGAYATPTTAFKDAESKKFVVLDDGDGDPNRDGAYRKSAGLNGHEGMVHIVAGHGGTKNTAKYGGNSPVMRKVTLDNGSVLVNVKGDTLTATMVTYQGKEFDTFQIVKSGKVEPQRIEKPKLRPPSMAFAAMSNSGETPPADGTPLIKAGAEWSYWASTTDPDSEEWTKMEFDDASWKTGAAPFGYGYNEAKTKLADMGNNYKRVYLRSSFALEHIEDVERLGLVMAFDDAFIAYVNGTEVLRQNIRGGSGKNAQGIEKIGTASSAKFYPLTAFKSFFKAGKNVVAIEGHNDSKDSHDFLLSPSLVLKRASATSGSSASTSSTGTPTTR